MARVQQQGVNAVTIWMIVFVVLWLVSTVLLVWLYTYQEDLRTAEVRARTAKNRAVADHEEQAIPLLKEAGPNQTMVGLLEAARKLTARYATGIESDLPAAIQTKVADLKKRLDQDPAASVAVGIDGGLFPAMAQLYELYRATDQNRRDLANQLQTAQQKITALVSENNQQKDDFERRVRELTQKVETAEKSRADYRQGRDAETERLRKEMDERRSQADADLTRVRNQLADRDQKLTELQTRYDALSEKCGAMQMSPLPMVTARQADGRILRAVAGEPVVYINLGRKDRLTLGLEFAVYSSATGIPADGRSKARVEVVSMADHSAECRIVQVHGNEVILEGDLVANPIYDRERALTFVVLGEFDLNRDGVADARGAATIEALIANWGGTVTTDLTALTDFVVVGAAPRKPRSSKTETVDPSVTEAMTRVYDDYVHKLNEARSLSLPILTQDVFLQFLGYGRNAPFVMR